MKPAIHPHFKKQIGLTELREPPSSGWLQAARRALGLSLKRLGKLTGKSPQSIKDAEQREVDGSISLGRLREIGAAMDMELVYGFVPRGGNLEELQKRRAYKRATDLLKTARHQMRLEDQCNDRYDIADEARELAEILLQENPDAVWT